MSASTAEPWPVASQTNVFQKLWTRLTAPSTLLSSDEQQKARLLSAVLLIFIPLSLAFTIFNPLISALAKQTVSMPTSGQIFAIIALPFAYIASRTRYFRTGAWLTISISLTAILLSLVDTRGYTNVVPLFYLSITVTLAGLLLYSRDTLILGGLLVIILLVVPRAPSSEVPETQKFAVISFVITSMAVTVFVGRIREENLRTLETREKELSVSLKETQSARAQAEYSRERAERSDQVKSAFLASMSHELRTPLNAIINFTEFVVAGDTGPVNEEQRELLTEVVGSGRHLLNLINDVLDMSKIEAGSLSLFIEDGVNLKGLIEGSLSTCRSLVKPGVHLEVNIQADLPTIRADRQRILQILLNILSNACKFTEQGSITLIAKQSTDEVLISVADTGPGIKPEDQELVFQAFKQTQTGLRQAGGTGLGMPIAKSLAEAHMGRLWLESQWGQGTTFFLTLPVKAQTLKPTL